IMGLAMMDVFSVSLPVPQKLIKLTGSRKKKGFFSSFLIGATSGVIIGPCTAPVLAVLLGFVAMRTNLALGVSLFLLSVWALC
ncbi:MAG TPA: cytochrome c biogenesis protein CcdA, partial [Smithellaceae bacterium]|nr:cytochrome c biogenesis protein CcdA [Smithellaceae bacterium]